MSYPQPNADLYAINGSKFFRLNTPLVSDGDIYESAQSTAGLAIGPDSDISKVNIAYFDDQVQGFQNQLAISPQRPFPGLIAARNEVGYEPSNVPGRILMWPDDLYNPDWRPSDFDPGQWRLDFVQPVLDVVEYFSPVGQVVGRNDKTYRYHQIPINNSNGGFWGLVIPFYGRRYASIFFGNLRVTNDPITLAVYGLTYSQGSFGDQDSELTIISAGAAVAAGASTMRIAKASTTGMHDALFLRFSASWGDPPSMPTTEVSICVTTSDTEV